MADHAGQSEHQNTSNVLSIRDRFVVATIDYRRARIYPLGLSGDGRPELVLDVDPEGHSREIAHRAGNPGGTYEAGSSEYWRGITDALRPAREILVLGNGKANASHLWVAYIEKHDHDVAAKVVADVRADIDSLTDAEVLARARHHFDMDRQRYEGRDPGAASSSPPRVRSPCHESQMTMPSWSPPVTATRTSPRRRRRSRPGCGLTEHRPRREHS